MRSLFLCLIVVLALAPYPSGILHAQEDSTPGSQLSGYLDAMAVYALDGDTIKEYPTTELGLQFKTQLSPWFAMKVFLQAFDDGTVIDPQNGKLFLELDKVYQDKNPYVDIDEAYFDLYSPHADLRVGIQKFAWGVLDEINPTDNLNTEDFTHGPVYDESERKIGTPAVKANVYSPFMNVELAWIPWFVPYRLPTPEERWFPGVLESPQFIETGTAQGNIPVTARYVDIDVPDYSFEDSQAGIRLSNHLWGVDFSLSYFRGYSPKTLTEVPTDLIVTLQDPVSMTYDLALELTYVPVARKIQVFGFDISTTLGSFTLRGEYAYFKNNSFIRKLDVVLEQETSAERQQQITDSFLQTYLDSGGTVTSRTYRIDPEVVVEMDSMRYGLGVDYLYGDTSVCLQAIQEYIRDYDESKPVYFNKEGIDTLITLLFTQFFFQNTLELSLRGAYGIEFKDYLVKPSVSYRFTDSLTGTIGAVILGGKHDDSLFGQFRDNDEIFATLRCTF